MKRIVFLGALAAVVGVVPAALADSTAPMPQTAVRSLGDWTDVPYTGSGNASINALLKALYAQHAIPTFVSQPDIRATSSMSVATAGAVTAAPPFIVTTTGLGTAGLSISGLTASGAVLTPVYENNAGVWSAGNTLEHLSTLTTDGNLQLDLVGHVAVGLQVTTPGTGSVSIGYSLSPLVRSVAFTTQQPTYDIATEAGIGTPADAVWSGTGNGSTIALLKSLYSQMGALITDYAAPLPPGTNAIGKLLPNALNTTQGSGTINSGGTYQQISAANASRGSLEIQNKSGADNCYLFFGTTAAANAAGIAGGLIIYAGQDYLRASGTIPGDAVQLTCATTGDPFYATFE
jgi:hypothetical protein